jgi:hypothetical protein
MPLKIPVGRIGQWKHPKYGTIKMAQQHFNDMIKNFKAKAIGRNPFIRIGHDKSEDPTFGGAKAEGWITDLVQEGDVLYAFADPTNQDVADMVKSKRYRYSSPEYQENYQDKETGASIGTVLLALSLTNEPFLTRLPEARLLADPADTFYLDQGEPGSSMKDIDDDMRQLGHQVVDGRYILSDNVGGESVSDEAKRLADESMTALGYTIIDGKYVLE